MNEFKESYKVERENTGKIIITEALKEILIDLLKGNITKQEVMSRTGIGDKQTIEVKIQEMVSVNPELTLLYEEYINKKSTNFSGYNFRAEAIDMLRNDYSQTFMASKIGINRRSFSTKMKILQLENSDNILGTLLRRHADRKMKKEELSPQERIKTNCMLDEYEEEYPVGTAKYEKKNPIEARLEVISKVLESVDELKENGITIKELSDKKIISESSYRKYKEETENLSKILEGKNRKEE